MTIKTRALFLDEGAPSETTDLRQIKSLIERHQTIWIDLGEELDEDDRVLLNGPLQLHSLVVEDIYNQYSQPKLEDFDGYRYLVLHTVSATLDTIDMGEIDLLVGKHWVVTHRSGNTPVLDVWAECARRARLLEKGAPWVAHAIADRIVDAYTPLAHQFETKAGELEEHLLSDGPTRESLKQIFALKRVLLDVRRISLVQNEVFGQLARRETPVLPAEILPYFREVHDHFNQIRNLGETYREIVANLFDLHVSLQSQKMNEVMKVLTMFSTLMLPLTLIAGVYGMNFENMPELKWTYGYPGALGLMLVVGASLMVYFRRKGWLGGDDSAALQKTLQVTKP